MTRPLFREDSYLRRCQARVESVTADGICLDQTVCYPRGGGQPGDTGRLVTDDGRVIELGETLPGEDGAIIHVPSEDGVVLMPGEPVSVSIDWPRRFAHMRMHTCLHLLGAVLRYGVTGGNVGIRRSRLDFDMPDAPDREKTAAALNALVRQDLPVRAFWISEEALDARPDLVRTLSVRPPRGAGRVRLLEIPGVDLQPCGGTHVAHTGEIGAVRVARIEKKGKRNRRVYVELEEPGL
ncbi:MAG: alanyl-tRNA editing protein [Gammaproteobacteria bacterium]